VLCAKSYKIKKNTAAAVAAVAVSRSPVGGHRAASPLIGRSTVQVWLATDRLLLLLVPWICYIGSSHAVQGMQPDLRVGSGRLRLKAVYVLTRRRLQRRRWVGGWQLCVLLAARLRAAAD